MAAGSGVRQRGVAFTGVAQRCVGVFDVLARAGAGVSMRLCNQLVEGGLVKRATCGLPHGRRIGQQATGGQLLQDEFGGARYAAGGVYVFNAHQPYPGRASLAIVPGTGVQPARQSGNQRARMQRAGG